jgi:hypothetical protein
MLWELQDRLNIKQCHALKHNSQKKKGEKKHRARKKRPAEFGDLVSVAAVATARVRR